MWDRSIKQRVGLEYFGIAASVNMHELAHFSRAWLSHAAAVETQFETWPHHVF